MVSGVSMNMAHFGGSVGRQNEWNSPGVFVMIPAPSFPQQLPKTAENWAKNLPFSSPVIVEW